MIKHHSTAGVGKWPVLGSIGAVSVVLLAGGLLLAGCSPAGTGTSSAGTGATTPAAAATTAATTEATAAATTEATGTPEATATKAAGAGVTETTGMTETGGMTGTSEMTGTTGMTETGSMTGTSEMTGTSGMTETGNMTGTSEMTGTSGMTETGNMTGTSEMTGTGATTGTTAAGEFAMLSQNSKLGNILVDGKGMTLYVFDKDTPGQSNCTGQCLVKWPPFTVADAAMVQSVSGASGKFSTITGDSGKLQVTVNGMPLYYYSSDKNPGDAQGQGVGEVWWVVGADGNKITTK